MRPVSNKQKQLTGKLIALIAEGVLVLLVLLMLGNMSFGWFVNNKTVTGTGMSVRAGSVAFPDIQAWRYDMTASISGGDENGDTLDKTGAWVNVIDETTATTPKGILPVAANGGANGSEEKFLYRSIHLGTVDNLLTLSDDNYFYVRVDVTGTLFRSRIGYTLTTEDLHFYDLEGNDETAQLTDQQKQDFVDLFWVDCAVSTTAYSPQDAGGKAAIDALFEGDGQPGRLTNAAALTDLGKQSQAYYIYLRFMPDLEKCFDATDDVASFMPCEITYDVTVDLRVD